MDHAIFPFDQLKAFVSGLIPVQPRPMVDLTPEQRQALHEAGTAVPARDPETSQEYVIVQREALERLKRALDVDEIDPSFFEFEEIDTIIDAPRTL
jgi:hypothetical protein